MARGILLIDGQIRNEPVTLFTCVAGAYLCGFSEIHED